MTATKCPWCEATTITEQQVEETFDQIPPYPSFAVVIPICNCSTCGLEFIDQRAEEIIDVKQHEINSKFSPGSR